MFGKVWMCTLMEGDERIEAVEEEESGARFNVHSTEAVHGLESGISYFEWCTD